ncbi:unnamed protein product [Closterium sp. NIES-53]
MVPICCSLCMCACACIPPGQVRTHLQLATLRATPGKPLTMLGATSAIYKSQGLPGFFRGVVPRVLKRSMQQALTWTLFERLSSVLSGRTLWDRKDPGPARRTGV